VIWQIFSETRTPGYHVCVFCDGEKASASVGNLWSHLEACHLPQYERICDEASPADVFDMVREAKKKTASQQPIARALNRMEKEPSKVKLEEVLLLWATMHGVGFNAFSDPLFQLFLTVRGCVCVCGLTFLDVPSWNHHCRS
jgi:hypothetical protein